MRVLDPNFTRKPMSALRANDGYYVLAIHTD